MKKLLISILSLLFCHLMTAQSEPTDSIGPDTIKRATEELPLEPEREFLLHTSEGTWMSLDVSPDGANIAFDLLGDIYTVPIAGGKATRGKTLFIYFVK